ncbi:MAG: tail fiber domain-containing protein [Chitinophagaceae bacterium]
MKKNQWYVLALFASLFTVNSYAQNVAINEDGSLPNANAMLDVKSSTKGLLIPRVSTTGRLAIPNTKGLLVYDTTANSFWYNTGTGWENMAAASSGAGWSLTGNSGTTSSNFLGTTDSKPLIIKVGNVHSGRIEGSVHNNTFLGFNTAPVTTGRENTATGAFTLFANTEGHNNTVNGAYALSSNTIGFNNTAIGSSSMERTTTGYNNVGIGVYSLSQNTTGADNTASGTQALQFNSTGSVNTATGLWAMHDNTTGANNAAHGGYSMIANTVGVYNTSSGAYSLFTNTTGGYNTATGGEASKFNLDGTGNTGTGYRALYNNRSGHWNTSAGAYSMTGNVTGGANTTLGAFTDVVNGATNATAIGYSAFSNVSNKVRIGNSAVTVIEGQVPFTTPSDGRYKYQVKEDVKGLDFIMQLRPVTYQFDVKRFDAAQRKDQKENDMIAASNIMQASYNEAAAIRRTGFIAQEVEKAASVSGYNFSGVIKPKTAEEHYSLSYESFVVPLVKAVQEQQKIIIDLQNQINELKKSQQRSK